MQPDIKSVGKTWENNAFTAGGKNTAGMVSQPNTKVICTYLRHLTSYVCKKVACACQEQGQTASLTSDLYRSLHHIVGGKALQTEIEREGRGSKGGQREDTAGRRIRKIRKEDTTFIKIYIDLDPKPPKTMGTLLTSCLFSALCCFNDRFPCALACAWGTTGVVGVQG